MDYILKEKSSQLCLNNGTQVFLDNDTTRVRGCVGALETKMRVNVNHLDYPRDQD